MTAFWLLLGGLVLVGLTAVATFEATAAVGPVLRSRVRKQYVVTMKDGKSWRGVLAQADRQTLVLRKTVALSQGYEGADLPVDGELIVQRADVDYLQLP